MYYPRNVDSAQARIETVSRSAYRLRTFRVRIAAHVSMRVTKS